MDSVVSGRGLSRRCALGFCAQVRGDKLSNSTFSVLVLVLLSLYHSCDVQVFLSTGYEKSTHLKPFLENPFQAINPLNSIEI